jgi:hypothetical protein
MCRDSSRGLDRKSLSGRDKVHFSRDLCEKITYFPCDDIKSLNSYF